MSETCNVTITGQEEGKKLQETVAVGSEIEEIAKKLRENYTDDPVLAYCDGKMCELHTKVQNDCTVSFVTTAQRDGQRAYRRSVVFLMQKALSNLLPEDQNDVHVMYSIDSGYFCRMESSFAVTDDFLDRLKEEMHALADQDLPLRKYVMKTHRAEEMFHDSGMYSKERLLYYRSSSNTNIYDLDGCCDYFYGYMVPSTGYLKYFDLIPFENGFVLLFPKKDGHTMEQFRPPIKLFHVLQESAQWSDMLKIPTVGALNDAIAAGKSQEIVLMQEALMEETIGSLARRISMDRSKKFIMIAGPSSSGKTTFSHRLAIQLRAQGLHPHPFSLDNYYKNRDEMPLDEFGQKDFEALEGLDIELFNSDMTRLLAGEKVDMPVFNFKLGKREYRDHFMQLGPDDVLVIEGIHGLNDRLSYSLPQESKFKIYISALTQLAIDEHNPLSTTDGRLIRRIVRDARTRGTTAQRTLAMWASVRRGEERNIFPFQEAADAMFNSALIYEMAVLKLYAVPLLYSVDRKSLEYAEAKRLLKLLDYFLPIPTEGISQTSLIREFIGGSCFDV